MSTNIGVKKEIKETNLSQERKTVFEEDLKSEMPLSLKKLLEIKK
jgi:hypothetical protein